MKLCNFFFESVYSCARIVGGDEETDSVLFFCCVLAVKHCARILLTATIEEWTCTVHYLRYNIIDMRKAVGLEEVGCMIFLKTALVGHLSEKQTSKHLM